MAYIKLVLIFTLLVGPAAIGFNLAEAQSNVRQKIQRQIAKLEKQYEDADTPAKRRRLKRKLLRLRKIIRARVKARKEKQGAKAVPELDPTAASAAVLLVLGGAVVMFDRRRRA